MDSDRPPERWSLRDAGGWFLGLWPAAKERLHRWLHDSLPDCPYCAKWRDNADEWAEKCRAEEVAHAETASQLRAARVIAQDEKQRADEADPGTLIPLDIAFVYDPTTVNLAQIVANMTGPPKAVAPEPSQEPREPERPLPPIMQSATARRIAKETGIPTCRAAMIEGAGCTRKAGPALTTAELLGFPNDSEGCAKVAALRPLRKQPVAPAREAEA